MPDLTFSILCFCSYLFSSCGIRARGPTKEISPLRTLNNCGSSSKDSRRIILPRGVTLGSFSRKSPLSRYSLINSGRPIFLKACSGVVPSHLEYCDLNLYSLNFWSPRVKRIWLKTALALGSVIFSAMKIIRKNGDSKMMAIKLAVKSKMRLTTRPQPISLVGVTLIIGTSPINSSISTRSDKSFTSLGINLKSI